MLWFLCIRYIKFRLVNVVNAIFDRICYKMLFPLMWYKCNKVMSPWTYALSSIFPPISSFCFFIHLRTSKLINFLFSRDLSLYPIWRFLGLFYPYPAINFFIIYTCAFSGANTCRWACAIETRRIKIEHV